MDIFSKIERLCGFYVSNMHFATMILPFINMKIKEKNNFYTFFEINLEKNIETILNASITNETEIEKILTINWKSTNVYKYADLEKKLKNKLQEKNIILICGSEDYIKIVNENINRFLQKNEKKIVNKEIKIIDCYRADTFNENIKEILDAHDKVINTSGEHEIAEIFTGYEKKII